MGYRRKWVVEIQKNLFLALVLDGVGGQGNIFTAIPREKHNFALYMNQGEPHGRLYMYGGTKNFFQLTVFVPETLQPSESIGILKEIFGFCGRK